MLNKFLSLVILLVLAGCQAHSVSGPPAPTYASTHPATTQSYLHSATSAIQSRFYDVDTYKGRECNLRLHQLNGQMPDSVKSEGGDEQLCEAAVAATKQAINMGLYPYKPTDKKQIMPDDISFKFRPQ
ncbi:hypothetical protein NB703_001514 [Pantoea ananatis]|uniref:Cell envelope integrity protein TolA n=1 Tax=Pantoea ananas TaxID=553 RepID=A0AAJ1FR08_PANAN|nr:cell envelope integrity TolA C-terminal domain-containing protein [Pantoea ananatis]MCW0343421.1 hypothetical protein [Pantoea ananatis]